MFQLLIFLFLSLGGVHSDTVGVHSDTVGVHSDTIGVHSDTVGVHSDTIEFYIATKQNNVNELLHIAKEVSNPRSKHYLYYWSEEQIIDFIKLPDEDLQVIYHWLEINNINYIPYGDSIKCIGEIKDIEKLLSTTIYCKEAYHWYPVNYPKDYTDINIICKAYIYSLPLKLKKLINFITINMPVNPMRKRKKVELPSTYYNTPGYTITPVNISNDTSNRKKIKIIDDVSILPNTTNPVCSNGFVGREVIQNVYNISDYSANISIGVIEFAGEGVSLGDLNIYRKMNNLPSTNYTYIGDYYIPQIEGNLDIQMISNLKNAEYWVITNNYWVYEMAVDFFNMTKKPDIISISYGWAESGQCSIDTCGNITSEMYVNRVNIEFAKISLTGTSIVVSSGDAGAPGRTSEQCQSINPIFPGSSEWVTSVGATYLYGSGNNNNQTNMCQLYGCNNGNKEYPINYNAMAPYSVGWTTGGGFAIYPKNGPIYQNKYKEIYKKSGVHFPKSFNFNGRMYPDISIVGHNCFMVLESGIYAVDGTSCSAPIMASFIGLMMQEVNSTLGCVNQLLYYMYDKDPTIYNDITNGYNFCTEYECCSNNYGFYAAPGPDAVSGLGTPNMGKILHFMTELSR